MKGKCILCKLSICVDIVEKKIFEMKEREDLCRAHAQDVMGKCRIVG